MSKKVKKELGKKYGKLAIHILQNFPPCVLNRDDQQSPKEAHFGGSRRTRVSSQCWKRIIRFVARDILASRGLDIDVADRTRELGTRIETIFVQKEVETEKASKIAKMIMGELDLVGGKTDSDKAIVF